jgi:hypothetical protein
MSQNYYAMRTFPSFVVFRTNCKLHLVTGNYETVSQFSAEETTPNVGLLQAIYVSKELCFIALLKIMGLHNTR